MIWTKGTHQSAKFQTLTAHLKFYQISTLIGSFCWKYIKFQPKKYRGFMSHDAEDWCKIRRNTELLFQNDKNWLNFDLSTRNSQDFHFDWFLMCKLCAVWPKKVQRSYLSWQWRVMQNLKKNWLVVWKITWRIWQIFTRALEKSQNWDFDGVLLSKAQNVGAWKLQRS